MASLSLSLPIRVSSKGKRKNKKAVDVNLSRMCRIFSAAGVRITSLGREIKDEMGESARIYIVVAESCIMQSLGEVKNGVDPLPLRAAVSLDVMSSFTYLTLVVFTLSVRACSGRGRAERTM